MQCKSDFDEHSLQLIRNRFELGAVFGTICYVIQYVQTEKKKTRKKSRRHSHCDFRRRALLNPISVECYNEIQTELPGIYRCKLRRLLVRLCENIWKLSFCLALHSLRLKL